MIRYDDHISPEPFYAKLGFVERPNEDAGAGMNQWLILEE